MCSVPKLYALTRILAAMARCDCGNLSDFDRSDSPGWEGSECELHGSRSGWEDQACTAFVAKGV